jgi:phytoene/squalene synthetase
MCLRVFLKDSPSQYDALVPSACALGSAFQKVNFLRDIKSDFQERERIYFPNVDFENFDDNEKARIEEDIQKEFDFAYEGIVKLPRGVRFGVYTAYTYYLNLFHKIKIAPKETILSKRVRISNPKKILLLTKSAVKNRFNFF